MRKRLHKSWKKGKILNNKCYDSNYYKSSKETNVVQRVHHKQNIIKHSDQVSLHNSICKSVELWKKVNNLNKKYNPNNNKYFQKFNKTELDKVNNVRII